MSQRSVAAMLCCALLVEVACAPAPPKTQPRRRKISDEEYTDTYRGTIIIRKMPVKRAGYPFSLWPLPKYTASSRQHDYELEYDPEDTKAVQLLYKAG